MYEEGLTYKDTHPYERWEPNENMPLVNDLGSGALTHPHVQ
jgi:hypothetical protein